MLHTNCVLEINKILGKCQNKSNDNLSVLSNLFWVKIYSIAEGFFHSLTGIKRVVIFRNTFA